MFQKIRLLIFTLSQLSSFTQYFEGFGALNSSTKHHWQGLKSLTFSVHLIGLLFSDLLVYLSVHNEVYLYILLNPQFSINMILRKPICIDVGKIYVGLMKRVNKIRVEWVRGFSWIHLSSGAAKKCKHSVSVSKEKSSLYICHQIIYQVQCTKGNIPNSISRFLFSLCTMYT